LNGPWRLGGKQPDFQVNVVEVREVAAPQGVEPLHWLLLTSPPCRTWMQVRRVVRRYTMRWCVEEYHKALMLACSPQSECAVVYQIHRM
jgi:hypothetical protein